MNKLKVIEECEIIRLFSFLGKRWTLPILYTFKDDPVQSFSRILTKFDNEINHTLLSGRFKNFMKYGILRKSEDNKYEITDFGKKVIQSLMYLKELACHKETILKIPEECKKGNCICSKF